MKHHLFFSQHDLGKNLTNSAPAA